MAVYQEERAARQNMLLLGADYVGFCLATVLLGPATILPTFVRLLGGSPVVVGSISTIQSGAWLLPQVFVGRFVADRSLVKRAVLVPAFAGRLALLCAVPLVALLARPAPAWALAVLLGCYIAFMVGDSVASVPWYDLLAKAVPGNLRGRLFGTAQAVHGFLALGMGLVVRVVLGRGGWPVTNHLILIALATLFFFLGTVATALVRETPRPVQNEGNLPWHAYFPHLVAIVRTNRRFVWSVVVRWFFGLADMGTNFYTLYALDRLGLTEASLGLFVSAQVAGNLLGGLGMGHLADRRGSGRVITALMPLRLLCPALALLAPHLGSTGTPRILAMLAVFALTGAINGCIMVSFGNYVLAIAPPGERPLYMGLANTLGGLVSFAPMAAGALVQATSYEFLFWVALAMALVGSVVALRAPQGVAVGVEK